ncbi:MAG: cyclopropane-fatty-acyl-phospholipid synthase family protein [Rhodospirillales bacterium]|nr:cyclopropane-fatty-acyl-phospholipid synthase family protein [Rhodospirillales bacterium]
MRLLNAMLSRFVRTGTLRIIDAKGRHHLHKGTAGPEVTLRLCSPKLPLALVLNPELRAGEAYMDGTLVIEQGTIRDFLTLFALNRENLRSQPLQRLIRSVRKRVRSLHQRNTASRSRKNAAHHYDLSNELYRLFLDDDLNYSCAYFLKPDDLLEVAQQNKLRHIAAKLALQPGQKVLDIGSGWGGMAFFLAEHADVEVLGITLSMDQHALATQRAKERGLEGRVRFEIKDYRDVGGRFDRIVSIGMFEHVGVGNYRVFFAKLTELLTPDGVALIHSIGRAGGPGATSQWFRKYIFPGSYAPALSEVHVAVEESGLWVTDLEILRKHYAETLRAWDDRFQCKRKAIASLLDERFCRMWEFYLIAAEMGFRYGKQMVFQLQLAKSVDALPLTRDYMAETEASPVRSTRSCSGPAPPDVTLTEAEGGRS